MVVHKNRSPFHSGSRNGRHIVRPLAVALVSLVFSLLFFSTAMMDLRRLESVLLDALGKKAQYIVHGIEKTVQSGYGDSTWVGNEYGKISLGSSDRQRNSFIRESVVRSLIDLARAIDSEEKAGHLTPTEVQNTALSEDLRSIVILDEQGKIVFQSGPVSEGLLSQAGSLIKEGQKIVVRLSARKGESEYTGSIGIRRQNGEGAVLLVLDQKGLQYRERKAALQEAVDELQWDQGIVYVAVKDDRDRLLAQAGRIPEEKAKECLLLTGSHAGPIRSLAQCMRVGEVRFLTLSHTLRLGGEVIGTALIGLETRETEQLLHENRQHILLWTGLTIFIGIIAMVFLYQWQKRYLSRVEAMREQLHHTERLSFLGKLGAGVAHEIRNPLNAVSLAVQRLQREFAPRDSKEKEEFVRITQGVREEIRRLNSIVEDFLSMSRNGKLVLRPQPIADLLQKTLALVRHEAEAKGVRFEAGWNDFSPTVLMDADKMEQVLLNLIRNAEESISDEGLIMICVEPSGKDRISLKISDTGRGIPTEDLKKIFDPYYTTKEKGLGLGLSIVHEIVLAHGGEIGVRSEPGKGTTFEILLPRETRQE